MGNPENEVLVYDVADLHVESGRLAAMPGPIKAYLTRREARWLRGAVAVLAVTPAMADEVAAKFGVDRPTVVMNARERWRVGEDVPRPNRLRTSIGVEIPAARHVVIYQGAFRPDQGIEILLAALREPALADRPLTAAFVGFGPLEGRLRAAGAAAPERIVVRSAVPSDELLAWTAGADVAFVGTPLPAERWQAFVEFARGREWWFVLCTAFVLILLAGSLMLALQKPRVLEGDRGVGRQALQQPGVLVDDIAVAGRIHGAHDRGEPAHGCLHAPRQGRRARGLRALV